MVLNTVSEAGALNGDKSDESMAFTQDLNQGSKPDLPMSDRGRMLTTISDNLLKSVVPYGVGTAVQGRIHILSHMLDMILAACSS